MLDPFGRIEQFYRDIIGLPIPKEPTRLTPAQKKSAVEHWDEERKEFLEAETLEDEIDACIDLAWLALGRVIEMGANLPAHFAEVVRANMDRVPGHNTKRPNSTGFDAIKPEGWQGPDHIAILHRSFTREPDWRRHGSEPQRVEHFLDWLSSDKPIGAMYALERGDGRQSYVQHFEHPKLLRKAMDRTHYGSVANSIEAEMIDAGNATDLSTTGAVVGMGALASRPPVKIILVGHGRHGKDTVAEKLRDQFGLKFVSSSLFCAEKVMMPAFDKHRKQLFGGMVTGHAYPDAETCYNDRHNYSQYYGDHRTFWFNAIKEYCTPDKARLAREIFAEHDIYVGIRDRRELWAAQLIPNTITVWVDASDRLPPEQASSMNIEPWMANVVLDNNGTLEDLDCGVKNLMLHIEQLLGY